MLVTGLAEQAPRPKRIGSLALPLASFGGPFIAGVMWKGKALVQLFKGVYK